tara:strand:+ start:79275 stop:79520 length:246 start_codon:yes stop_codon:yes gene_type:complete
MIGAQPKKGKPVEPDYYYGDIKFQRKYLLDFCNAENSQRSLKEPKIDVQQVVHRCMKRIGRYYGQQTKYNSDGSLKEGLTR